MSQNKKTKKRLAKKRKQHIGTGDGGAFSKKMIISR
jgi:hypothetical protein